MKEKMKKSILAIFSAAAVLASISAQATVTVIAYDLVDTFYPIGGIGPWRSIYTGSQTVRGYPYNLRAYTYTGGRGSLNDGLFPNGVDGSALFHTSQYTNPGITLHLSEAAAIDEIDLFGGVLVNGLTQGQGSITGATITIGGTSVALKSTGFGPMCSKVNCNDRFSLAGTALAGLKTDTIVLNNFTLVHPHVVFTLEEVGVNAAIATVSPVPEPETYAMTLAGLGLIGFMARRRKRAA